MKENEKKRGKEWIDRRQRRPKIPRHPIPQMLQHSRHCPTNNSPVTPELPYSNAYTNAQKDWQLCRPRSDRLLRSSLILVSSVYLDLSARNLGFTVDTVMVYLTTGYSPREVTWQGGAIVMDQCIMK